MGPLTWFHRAVPPCRGKEPEIRGEAERMPQGRLAGKNAIITGANRGIGFAIATLFVRDGAQCVLVVQDRAAGEEAARTLAAEGPIPMVGVADVSDRGEVAAVFMEVIERMDRVDLIVNNAGILLDEDRNTPPSRMNPAVFERTMGVNLHGAIITSQVFLPLMQRGGRIINVSSTMGQLSDGSAGYAPAYCISKTALNAFTQALAAELSPRGMMVDSFHPGWAKTRMGGPNATVDPFEAANVAYFLATRPDDGVTGKFWRHDGVIDW
jgi:NAD(P)-dependent dehydrogenase (short-subunit alcohol dehydrogenase family)